MLRLIEKCKSLLQRVQGVPAVTPGTTHLRTSSPGMEAQRNVIERGLEAIEWTVEERGLAGLGNLSGLPWRLPMDDFFEAWVEAVANRYCTLRGGTLRTGRKRETVTPLSWDPPYLGSQSSLRPDLIIDRGDRTIVLDAKYKSHWEDLNVEHWSNIESTIRERHRADLLQVLAYANLADVPRVTTCLLYSCRLETWRSLRNRNRLVHTAELGDGRSSVTLALAAVSLETDLQEATKVFKRLG